MSSFTVSTPHTHTHTHTHTHHHEHPSVKVVWGKEKLSVELDDTEDPDTFRAQLFALTQVDPDRMKLMFKGKVITVSPCVK